ncbi:MAG: hypothetical protein V1744_01565 [Candidatus Altiarchaeota archaeon]
MASRKKRLGKRVESLKRQIEIHEKKIECNVGVKGMEHTLGYWEKEIANRKKEIDYGLNVLKKNKKKKRS